MRGLINLLKENPDIEKVYFNDQGGWLIDGDKRHAIIKSRDEILALEDSLPAEHVTNDDVESLLEEIKLLKEENELLKVEKSILEEDKAAHQAKIDGLQEQIKNISAKTEKIKKNATT
jgi:hypothetical protein